MKLIEWQVVIVQGITFGVLVLLLWTFLYKRIVRLLNMRTAKIENDLATAKAKKDEAENLKETYQKKLEQLNIDAQLIIKEATIEAYKAKERILQDAKTQAKKIIDSARQQCEREYKLLFERLRGEVAHLTVLATKAILQRTIDENKARQLVDEFINKLPTIKIT